MGILDKAMDQTEQLIDEGEHKIGQLAGNEKLANAGMRVWSQIWPHLSSLVLGPPGLLA